MNAQSYGVIVPATLEVGKKKEGKMIKTTLDGTKETRILLCEGLCGENKKTAKEIKKEFFEKSLSKGLTPKVAAREAARETTERLVPRPHRPVGGGYFECTVCQHVRTYGARPRQTRIYH